MDTNQVNPTLVVFTVLTLGLLKANGPLRPYDGIIKGGIVLKSFITKHPHRYFICVRNNKISTMRYPQTNTAKVDQHQNLCIF